MFSYLQQVGSWMFLLWCESHVLPLVSVSISIFGFHSNSCYWLIPFLYPITLSLTALEHYPLPSPISFLFSLCICTPGLTQSRSLSICWVCLLANMNSPSYTSATISPQLIHVWLSWYNLPLSFLIFVCAPPHLHHLLTPSNLVHLPSAASTPTPRCTCATMLCPCSD